MSYDDILTKKVLKRTKEFALPKLDDIRKFREDSDMFFTRIYLEAFLDALIAEGYTYTIEKKDESSTN